MTSTRVRRRVSPTMGKSKATRCTKRQDWPKRRKKRSSNEQEEAAIPTTTPEGAAAILSPDLMEGMNENGGNPVVIMTEAGSSGTGKKRKLDARGHPMDDEVRATRK